MMVFPRWYKILKYTPIAVAGLSALMTGLFLFGVLATPAVLSVLGPLCLAYASMQGIAAFVMFSVTVISAGAFGGILSFGLLGPWLWLKADRSADQAMQALATLQAQQNLSEDIRAIKVQLEEQTDQLDTYFKNDNVSERVERLEMMLEKIGEACVQSGNEDLSKPGGVSLLHRFKEASHINDDVCISDQTLVRPKEKKTG